jgi:membrane associated rhomboid family serine protease
MLFLAVMIALEAFFLLRPEMRDVFYIDYIGVHAHVWMGDFWRPFTSCLMHGNLLHALFNLWWFAVFSSVLEPYFGWKRYLVLLVLLAYVSMLPEFVVQSYLNIKVPMMVGISGVLYGQFGLLLVGRRYRQDFFEVCNHQVAPLLIAWFFICIFLTWSGLMGVANIAHGAGWFFGWLYGKAIFSHRKRVRWIVLAVVLSLIVLATLAVCPGSHWYELFRQRHELWWQPDAWKNSRLLNWLLSWLPSDYK